MNGLLLASLIAFAAAPQDAPVEKLPLEVLYASNAGTPYSEAWTEFLRKHTEDVRFVALASLTRADFEGRDVVLIDGEVDVQRADGSDGLRIERLQLTLDDVQGVPIVLMGGQGGAFADVVKLKTSWGHG